MRTADQRALSFSVTSRGSTGRQWIAAFQSQGYELDDRACKLLRSRSFVPTDGVTSAVTILPMRVLAEDQRYLFRLRARAAERGLSNPSIELSCLISMALTPDRLLDMGFDWVLMMHGPLEAARIRRPLLMVGRDFPSIPSLTGVNFTRNNKLNADGGVAFITPRSNRSGR